MEFAPARHHGFHFLIEYGGLARDDIKGAEAVAFDKSQDY
jgi:hypothetical protein